MVPSTSTIATMPKNRQYQSASSPGILPSVSTGSQIRTATAAIATSVTTSTIRTARCRRDASRSRRFACARLAARTPSTANDFQSHS